MAGKLGTKSKPLETKGSGPGRLCGDRNNLNRQGGNPRPGGGWRHVQRPGGENECPVGLGGWEAAGLAEQKVLVENLEHRD